MCFRWVIMTLSGLIVAPLLALATPAAPADGLTDLFEPTTVVSLDGDFDVEGFYDSTSFDFDRIVDPEEFEHLPITTMSFDDMQFEDFALSVQTRAATGKTVFIFSPRKLRFYAYDRSGNLVGSGRASGGKGYCADVKRSCRTPVGTFSVHRKGSAYCKSSKYPLGRGGAPMPHCMFFRGGYAIHGSPDVPNWNASHGCIRVRPHQARWLHGNVLNLGSTVIVRSY